MMLRPGTKAPLFTVQDLGGADQSLGSLLADGAVLLVFFKISCPVCQFTLPYLSRIAGGALQIAAISQDDAASTERFAKRFGVTLNILLDSGDAGYPASNAYRIDHVPSLFLIEPDGTISMTSEGFAKADLEAIAARAARAIFHAHESVPQWKAG
jgi:peroxiredoxin